MSCTHIRRSSSMDCEDQDTLMFHSYPCAYYVQSPSTLSHANSAVDIRNINTTVESDCHSPTRSESTTAIGATTFLNKSNLEASRMITLSRYSSSRGSNNNSNFLHENKKVVNFTDVDDHDGPAVSEMSGQNRLIIVDHRHDDRDKDDDDDDHDDEDWYYGSGKKGLWWRYFSFKRSNSCAWISLQISWRLFLSLGVSLLVFYMATKPPPPMVSIKMAGIRQFGLGEGVDGTGVTTKILTCNCSIDLLIDNNSKLFGLHIHPPIMEMSFGRLPFALSHGPKLYAESHGSTAFQLYVGTTNKPMYGAGRNMQDMLESGMGLPLMIRMSFKSTYRVVWDLINPKFHHQAECLIVLHSKYDKKHRTQSYNSTCTINTY
ncbi:hypothetical protein Dsin_011022 [Dipteronia sinensis]|uniref:Late embryogenesis abundant protein LEA-2 subgroup domain-containing protein n=1 Tax=Dipteronia sinensis TaxID=43782 RepID=A0AAE0ATV2_9ROSI|nr:hypothetical protein Dsin_011022 [Dipteronia sinensis]